MDPVLLLVLGGIGIALAGVAVGVVIGRVTGRARKAAELEQELEQTKEAFEDYRSEVVQQFADTAGKFRRLNESYSDLHQQLATSASVLCADRAGDVLLALPGSEAAENRAADIPDTETIDGASEAVVEEVSEEITETVSEEVSAVGVSDAGVSDAVAEVDLPDDAEPADPDSDDKRASA